jgi:signal peptidase I
MMGEPVVLDPDSMLNVPDVEADAVGETGGAGRFLLKALWDVVSTDVPAVLIAIFINRFIAQAMVVQGPSMQPTLHYNQRVMVEKLTYRLLHGPRRGDVVVIEIEGEDEPLIKRVVAVAGETVEVRSGQALIDGEALDESWTTYPGGPGYPITRIPPLHIFVMGDNRGSSRDSRAFGAVSLDHVIGRAWLVYWPLSEIKLVQ